jgi:hypothetical protein
VGQGAWSRGGECQAERPYPDRSSFLPFTQTLPNPQVQSQLNRGNPSFSVVAHARKTGLALYRGLPPLLIGAPLQCAVRFSALEGCRAYSPSVSLGSVRAYVRWRCQRVCVFSWVFLVIRDRPLATLTPPPTRASPHDAQPSRSTDLVAGMLAGAVEAALVVTPMEAVKTRLVDSNAGLVRGVAHIVRQPPRHRLGAQQGAERSSNIRQSPSALSMQFNGADWAPGWAPSEALIFAHVRPHPHAVPPARPSITLPTPFPPLDSWRPTVCVDSTAA